MNNSTVFAIHPLLLVLLGMAAGVMLAYLLFQLKAGRRIALSESRVQQQTEELASLRQQRDNDASRIEALLTDNAGLNATLEAERTRYSEQIKLLQETRENLTRDFENLANKIFDEKQSNFNRQSRLALDATVNPLREDITNFRKQVEHVYTHENAERNKLWGQIQELKTQAERIGEDAVATDPRPQRRQQNAG
jgi:Uncharacterized protein conserved in bacteria